MKKIKLLTVAVGVILSACTAIPQQSKTVTAPTVNTDTPIAPTAFDPKNVLAMALQTQVRSAFSYQTDAYIQKQIQEQSPTTKDNSCDDIHDKAYIALAKEAKTSGKLITDDEYKDKAQIVKQEYQDCLTKAHSYQLFDFDKFYQENQHLNYQDRAAIFLEKTDSHIQNQAVIHTNQDEKLKKDKLLDAYLLKPSHLSVTGRYEPRKGGLTALPMLTYQANNIDAMINQPIYIDINTGRIYIWADNLALANNSFLDKTLGDQWQNKWLYFAINDGSLPKDFVKELLKVYVKAKAEGFLALPQSNFAKIDAQELPNTSLFYQNLSKSAQDTIINTPYVVQSKVSKSDKDYSRYVFLDTFYHELTKKYPELTLENALGIDSNPFFERYITEGESVIHISNLDQEEKKVNGLMQKPFSKVDSKILTVALLNRVKDYTENYLETQSIKTSKTEDNQKIPVTHYGIENGKVSWVYQQLPLDKNIKGHDQPFFVDVFTQIYQDKKEFGEFTRLPKAHQMPNEQNSINILEYKESLVEKLKDSDDKYLQVLLLLLDMDKGSDDADLQDDPSSPVEFDEEDSDL